MEVQLCFGSQQQYKLAIPVTNENRQHLLKQFQAAVTALTVKKEKRVDCVGQQTFAFCK